MYTLAFALQLRKKHGSRRMPIGREYHFKDEAQTALFKDPVRTAL